MKIEYVHEGETPHSKEIENLLGKLKNRHKVSKVDAKKMSEEEKWDYYANVLIPISVMEKEKLRGRIRTHKSGAIFFRDLVVVNGEKFYMDEEAVKILEKESESMQTNLDREMEYFDEVFEEERNRRTWTPHRETYRKRIKGAYPILKETARDGEVITYGELMNRIGTARGYIGLVLDGINRMEHKQGHPILSAVVVRADAGCLETDSSTFW